MERERDSGQGGVGADGDRSRKPRGGARTGSMSVAGWVITALVSTLAMGISGASGCGDTIDSKGQTETAGQREALGQLLAPAEGSEGELISSISEVDISLEVSVSASVYTETGMQMVEEKARMELGMLKPDEIFVHYARR